MLYAIISEDVDDSGPLRAKARPAHIERVKKMADEGRIIIAGPHPAIDAEDPGDAGFTGSLIVAEFDSLEDAEKWASEDPYIEAGVYKGFKVKPFKRVLP